MSWTMFERLQQGKAEDVEDLRVVWPMIIRYTDSAFIVVEACRPVWVLYQKIASSHMVHLFVWDVDNTSLDDYTLLELLKLVLYQWSRQYWRSQIFVLATPGIVQAW